MYSMTKCMCVALVYFFTLCMSIVEKFFLNDKGRRKAETVQSDTVGYYPRLK